MVIKGYVHTKIKIQSLSNYPHTFGELDEVLQCTKHFLRLELHQMSFDLILNVISGKKPLNL